MRKIATIDYKDYKKYNKTQLRKASRAIIFHDGLVLMIYSKINKDYKFPGGGMRVFEKPIDALVRETKEETGYIINESSIKEYGYIEEVKKSNSEPNTLFKMISQYYLCDVSTNSGKTNLDRYEKRLQYTAVFVEPEVAYEANCKLYDNPELPWVKRENIVLKKLMEQEN